MKRIFLILSVMLALIATTCLCLGEPANNTSVMDNTTPLAKNMATINETVSGNKTSGANAMVANSSPNLKYIWSVTGIEPGQVTMVLDQDGNDLFGQAKYEPDGGLAWNAEVVGTIVGDNVDLTLTAQKDKDLVTTKLSGKFANESISGTYNQVSKGKIVNKGSFSAMWINPDTSSYAPAVIEQIKPNTISASAETPNINTTKSDDQTSSQKSQKSKFVDVHEYADKIGPGGDLSGVPPGMGGSAGP